MSRRILDAMVLAILLTAGTAEAQATRTWVSGVGDDANPCSRTAPCKTFAGAISKTAAGGEINAIDSAGFGAVTITKSITIDGAGVHASILASLVTGIIVNAGSGDVVRLRNLSINGVGNGLSGIRFLAGAALHVENVIISGFSQRGIAFEPAGASFLYVTDTIVRNNAQGGIYIKPGGGGARAAIDRARLEQNGSFGLRADETSSVTVRDTLAAGNGTNGFLALSASLPTILFIESSTSSNNGTGVVSSGPSAFVWLSNVTTTGNNTGLSPQSGGDILSFSNNKNSGNMVDGAPTGNVPLQ